MRPHFIDGIQQWGQFIAVLLSPPYLKTFLSGNHRSARVIHDKGGSFLQLDYLRKYKMQTNEPLDLSIKRDFKNHIVGSKFRASKSILSCDRCRKAFDRPSLLKRHMRTHTGEKPHVCQVCKKGFSTSSSLNTHKRIHTGEKPHKCLECGKCFTASSNLYYHRMTHTKNKPHKCTLCPKSFPTPGDLRAHLYSHSGVWPYSCLKCRRGFTKLTNLRHHLQAHSEYYFMPRQ